MGRLQRILKSGAKRVFSQEVIGLVSGRQGKAAPNDGTMAETMRTNPSFQPAERPIFIIGAPRSGTSITTWALGQHPNIQPMPETGWIASMAVAAQISYDVGSERGRFSHLSNVAFPPDPFYRRMGEAIGKVVHDVFEERCVRVHGDWQSATIITMPDGHPTPEMRLRRRPSDPKGRWIDGTPLNSMYVWALAKLFPEARFIHLVRQPHEVVASLENFDAVGGIPHGLDDAIQNWMDHTHFAFLAQKALGSAKVYTARFEQIGHSPKDFFEDILAFLGEPWCEDCLAPLGKKINSSNVDGRRDKVRERVRNNQLFQRARGLYDEILRWEPTEEIDAEAERNLKDRFIEQCRGKRLIG